MKRIAVWATVQYAVHVDGATIHVTGPDERQVEFGDGTNAFATLSGGPGYLNSTVTVYAPGFVTMTGTSVNEMMALVRDQQAAIVSQQADIEALKQFVGMMPPSVPPPVLETSLVMFDVKSEEDITVTPGSYQRSSGTSAWAGNAYSSTHITGLDHQYKGISFRSPSFGNQVMIALRPVSDSNGPGWSSTGNPLFRFEENLVNIFPPWQKYFINEDYTQHTYEIRITSTGFKFAKDGTVFHSDSQAISFPVHAAITTHDRCFNTACALVDIRYLTATDAAIW